MNAEPTPTELMQAIVDLKDAMLLGFDGIDRRFDRVERRLDEHDRRFDAHDRQFEILNRSLGRIETRVEDLEHKLSA